MNETILLSHGGGGEEMNRLINETIFAAFDNEILRANNDSAILNLDAGAGFDCATPSSALNSAASFGGELAFSTDSFVVTPLFFNGGDIGKIAVCGTVNDLAMVGAKPLFLSCALIIEEGLSLGELRRILDSMASTASLAATSGGTGQ